MTAQPLRSDIAYPLHEFVLAGLAIGSLPAIPDRAVEYALKERDVVEKQTFRGVQGGHEFESSADSKHSRVQFGKPAERAVLAPGHAGEMVIPDQKIRIGADSAHRRAEVYASAYARRAPKDFA